MGGSPTDYPERYAAGSPYDLLPLGIRQFLIHGTADTDLPLEVSERYVRRAAAKGDSATLLTLPDVGHFELIDPASQCLANRAQRRHSADGTSETTRLGMYRSTTGSGVPPPAPKQG